MSSNTQNPAKSLSNTTDKDILKHLFISQERTIFQYLQIHTATASMVSSVLNIPQKNITRYKRNLEQRGLLYEVEKKLCKVTGFKAWYLSTSQLSNPKNLDNVRAN